jgi:hypothetical protein
MKQMWSAAMVVLALSAAPGAQSGKEMAEPAGDPMGRMYTGCVESVNHGGTFVLTHVSDGRQMTGHDGMKKDTTMDQKSEPAVASDVHMALMMPRSLVLTGSSDLNKHVGQKVTVTGPVSKGTMDGGLKNELDTLTVGSLKVVAKSCKQDR